MAWIFLGFFLLMPTFVSASLDLELIVSSNHNKSIWENSYPIVASGETFRVYARSINNSPQDFFWYIHFFYNNGSKISIDTPIFIAGNSVQDTLWFDTRFASPWVFNLTTYITPGYWEEWNNVADGYVQVYRWRGCFSIG